MAIFISFHPLKLYGEAQRADEGARRHCPFKKSVVKVAFWMGLFVLMSSLSVRSECP